MLYFLIFVILSFVYLLFFADKNNIKTIRLKKCIFPSALLIIMFFIIVLSQNAYTTAQSAFMLWVNNVIPSLLPFFICIELLKQTNFINFAGKLLTPIMRPLFNVPGSGAFALLMGISSGYPVGAKIASDLYKDNLCTKVEAERLIAFTNSSGPLFVISAVGLGMFENEKIGLILLLTHFLASITVGMIFKHYKSSSTSNIISHTNKKANSINLSNLGKIMGESINKSISTLLLIGGYIVFFAVINEIINVVLLKNIDSKLIISLLNGFLEITSGLKKISLLKNYSLGIILSLSALVLGFGGLSVHMQVASILSDSKLSLKPYLIGKMLQGIFAGIYTFLFIQILQININL